MPTWLKPLSTYRISPVMPAGHVRAQEGRGIADVLERDIAPQRCREGDLGQHLAKTRDARGRQRLDRARRDGVDADALGA